MKTRIQFGIAVASLASSLALGLGVWAQEKPHNPPPSSPPHPAQAHPQNQGTTRPPNATNANNVAHPNVNPNQNPNRPPQNYTPPQPHSNFNPQNGPQNGNAARLNQRQQLGVGAARPWVDTMRDLSPQQRERVLQNSKAFQNLSPDKQAKIRQQFNQWDKMSPQQQTNLRQNENTWRKLTPEQQQHIKNDVLPRWRQMPWDRQQVIKQKLGVLQNMPESARNQRLSDPNFTRGMSDDERSMLKDLSHTHVGGPPENQPE
ncbi:MAG TPA: DUF3106 domain-containing protein [Dongiaceae bacterium]|nr:DUF3106 domain-containing protein [Dongiaceae bacterium]